MAASGDSLLILIPCFNDWPSLRLLLARIDRVLLEAGEDAREHLRRWTVSVLVVDDASTDPIPGNWPGEPLTAIASLSVLHLRCNLGHQRAIALGLYHAHEFTGAAAVLVMDGDGEDRAEDVPALLAEFERGDRRQAIFAARTNRHESFAFQFMYRTYRVVHRVLTGIEVRVGNFSIVPRSALNRLMAVADVWNHFAASVVRARIPRRLLPLARGRRLEGRSHMNFVSLLVHGLAAISVLTEQVSGRLLAASAVFAAVGLLVLLGWAGVSLAAGWTPPAALIYAAAVFLGIAAQALILAVLFGLSIVSRRSSLNFLLLRDAPHFILGTTAIQNRSTLEGLSAALAREQAARPAADPVRADPVRIER